MIDESVFTARGRYTNPLPCTLQSLSIDPRLTLTFYLSPTWHAYVVPAASVWSWSVGGSGSWFDEGLWRCDVANVFKHITSFIIHSHPDSPRFFFLVFSSVRRGRHSLSRCAKLFNTFWFHVSYFEISNKSVHLLLFRSEGDAGGAILSPADFDLSTCVLILNFMYQNQ